MRIGWISIVTDGGSRKFSDPLTDVRDVVRAATDAGVVVFAPWAASAIIQPLSGASLLVLLAGWPLAVLALLPVAGVVVALGGLPWQEEFLHPERSSRMVSTASVLQVRQPVRAMISGSFISIGWA